MRRAGLLALAGVLALAGIGAIAACIVPAHRFDEPPAIDAPPPPDAAPLSMVTVPSGESIQGGRGSDSQPVHRVYTSSYEISSRCVTEAEYGACVAAGACPDLPNDGGAVGLGQINIGHATSFCAWLGMRVPTEAELERAHRGDSGATVIAYPGPYGLDACDFGGGANRVVVADGYRCDAYVRRAYANPLETDGPSFDRSFAPGVDLSTQMRFGNYPSYGIRCARTLDTSPPPAGPVQPTCTVNCEPTRLALGERFGCALRGGSVWCWGSNEAGQLGDGDTFDRMPASRAANPITNSVASIAAGADFVCARTTGGTISCWGSNASGQLGDGTTTNRNVPVASATATIGLAVSRLHVCVINSDTSVSCWGNRFTSSPAPVGISGATVIAGGRDTTCVINGSAVQCWGMVHDTNGTNILFTPSAPRTFTITATALAVGDGHGCAVVGTNVHCWGDRTHWGGTGIATVPEAITSTTVAPKVFVSDVGTLVFDQGAIVLNHDTGLPSGVPTDGDSFAFTPGTEQSGCATTAANATCWGIEHGQLGRSNGCDASPMTAALALP